MFKYTLGIDVGPTSIGWGVIDDENGRIGRSNDEIPGCGARIFPEGVDAKKNVSKNEHRRKMRGMRRQLDRRARRRRALKLALIELGIYPSDVKGQAAIEASLADERGAGQKLKLYALRHKATTSRIDLGEFGRVLLHINKRRGFKSNRKTERAGKDGKVSKATDALSVSMTNNKSSTIGSHLFRLGTGEVAEYDPETLKNEAHKVRETPRIRTRYTLRRMFEDEFDQMWKEQAKHHAVLLDPDVRERVRTIIFHQRPLKSSKRLIGRCECEHGEARGARANWHAQQFRILKDVNTLAVFNPDGQRQELTARQRTLIFNELSQSDELSFDEMRTMLELYGDQEFNLEAAPKDGKGSASRSKTGDSAKRKKLKGNSVEHAIRRAFGAAWEEQDDAVKEEVRTALVEVEDSEQFLALAKSWGLASKAASQLANAGLPDGYMRFSLKAMRRLNEHLMAGLSSDLPISEYDAREKCGYNRFGDQPTFDLLPLPMTREGKPLINNPVVRQALFELRKVVNGLIRHYGAKPQKIVVEMIRKLKDPANRRAEIKQRQEANRTEKDRIRKILQNEFRVANPTGTDILAYRLWEQQRYQTPYGGFVSGSPAGDGTISREHLQSFYDGHGVLQIDHILPYSKSLDDSQSNKVLCFISENLQKRDRTPREWLEAEHPDEYEKMLRRVASFRESGMPFGKRRKFSQKEVTKDGFVARQLNDTAYLAREVRRYLLCLFEGTDVERHQKVVCSRGQVTSALRHHWDLNRILADDDSDEKNRADHRHHAIDAIVTALADSKRLFQLSQTDRSLGAARQRMKPPWEDDFVGDVRRAVERIVVSHRVRRKITGALHEETRYGKDARLPEHDYVYRKPLTQLSLNEVTKIRDERIRELVIARLAEHGIVVGRAAIDGEDADGDDESSGKAGKIKAEVWKKPLVLLAKKTNRRKENSAVVRSVRITKRDQTMKPCNNGAGFIKPGNTHHVLLYEFTNETGQIERDAHFVTMLVAAKRAVRGEPVVQMAVPDHPQATVIMSLSIGEMVQVPTAQGLQYFRFETAPSTIKQLRFRFHSSAPVGELGKFSAKPSTFTGQKVAVDPIGRVRWAERTYWSKSTWSPPPKKQARKRSNRRTTN